MTPEVAVPTTISKSNSFGDSEETGRVFLAWIGGQEASFPLENPADTSWRAAARAHIERYVHPDVVVHGAPVRRPGRDGWADFMLALGDSHPDMHTTYDMTVVEGDMAAAYWTY